MALAEISKYTNFDLNILLDADKRFELARNTSSSVTDYSESYIAWRSTGSELGPNEQNSFGLGENKEIKLCVNNHDRLILVNNIGFNGVEVNDLETLPAGTFKLFEYISKMSEDNDDFKIMYSKLSDIFLTDRELLKNTLQLSNDELAFKVRTIVQNCIA
ncbi:hypothetical protein AMD27_17315 (plasmid) [Acinetobacter sp. TGL-Y2]|uniref:hypothetical protein n=1 Tax=Acinetobacter sp. TGL-Y2 TaxID=1407071 RepID=UPI0007A66994|nr:hypothetical protein [Acinetobacter sp. TGL-Y2]AMW80677.1 hypothetical protein AMD27_17315 [Acinetobacter sp. TGL-Y2]